MSNIFKTMQDEFLIEEQQPMRPIKLLHLMIILLSIVATFFIVSAILCFTNDECANRVPSLHNLLNSSFSAPFVVTALNTVLSIHGILVVCLYMKSEQRSFYGSRLQMLSAILLYILIGITLFVFPFSYRVNYASILVIFGLGLWMVGTMFTLRNYYRNGPALSPKRKVLRYNILAFGVFILSAAVYIGLKYSLQNEIGILIVELICGLSIFSFLLLVWYHVGNMVIEIK